ARPSPHSFPTRRSSDLDRQVGLMERRGVARAVPSEEAISIDEHRLRLRVDAAVAHPRRIADHDVEAATGHDVREMDIEREEAERSEEHTSELQSRFDLV